MSSDKKRLPIYLPPQHKEALERKAEWMGMSKNTVVLLAIEKFCGPVKAPTKSED